MIKSKQVKQFKQQVNKWNTTDDYTEKSIEFLYYELIKNYIINKYDDKDLVRVDYNSPYSSDGIITIIKENTTTSILLEAKYDKNYYHKNDLISVLCQAVYYVKRLENEDKLIPAVIALFSRNSVALIRTDKIVDYLSENSYDWDAPASQAFMNTYLYKKLLKDKQLNVVLFNIFEDTFDPNDMCDALDELLQQSMFKEIKTRSYNISGAGQESALQYTDYGLVEQFNKHTNNKYVFDGVNNLWYERQDTKLVKVSSVIVEQDLQSFLIQLSQSLNNYSMSIFRLSQKLLSMVTLTNVFTCLKIANTRTFDDSMIGLSNGVLNTTTMMIEQQDKNTYIRKYYDYVYDKDAKLSLVNNDEMNSYLQYLLSLSLSKNTNKIVFFTGSQKTVLQEIFDKLDFLNLESLPNSTLDCGSLRGTVFYDVTQMPVLSNYDLTNIIIIDTNEFNWLLNDFDKHELFSSIINCACYVDVPETVQKTVTAWNENNDLMLSWFKEKINLSTNYFITTSDLLTCYNDWLKSRGNNTVSMRYFNEIFKNHKIFYTNNLVQKNQSRILKEYTQSAYNHDSKIYSASDRTNYILGIAFK